MRFSLVIQRSRATSSSIQVQKYGVPPQQAAPRHPCCARRPRRAATEALLWGGIGRQPATSHLAPQATACVGPMPALHWGSQGQVSETYLHSPKPPALPVPQCHTHGVVKSGDTAALQLGGHHTTRAASAWLRENVGAAAARRIRGRESRTRGYCRCAWFVGVAIQVFKCTTTPSSFTKLVHGGRVRRRWQSNTPGVTRVAQRKARDGWATVRHQVACEALSVHRRRRAHSEHFRQFRAPLRGAGSWDARSYVQQRHPAGHAFLMTTLAAKPRRLSNKLNLSSRVRFRKPTASAAAPALPKSLPPNSNSCS